MNEPIGKAAEQILTRRYLARLGANRLIDIVLEESGRNNSFRQRLAEATVAIAATGVSASHSEEEETEMPHMVGGSPPMRVVFDAIRKFAASDAAVLITGESGTGKELAAVAIHERSKYRDGPFVPINCAGLPPTLIASELFGHEKGAFTSAHQRSVGRIYSARGGTVFLDEIGDLPLEVQANLLRFLQEKSIDRVGSSRPISVDVRVIAATNTDLHSAVAEGRFRKDLFFRLNVLWLEMPPLRTRVGDVETLANYFLRAFAAELGRPSLQFEDSALEAIRRRDWPGNVRELISCVKRAVVMARSDSIGLGDLGFAPFSSAGLQSGQSNGSISLEGLNLQELSLAEAKNRIECALIQEMLAREQNVTRAAEQLQISRVTLYRLMNKHGIQLH